MTGHPIVESSTYSLYAILEAYDAGTETSKIVELSIPITSTTVRFLSYPHYRVPERPNMVYLQKRSTTTQSALFLINNFHGITS